MSSQLALGIEEEERPPPAATEPTPGPYVLRWAGGRRWNIHGRDGVYLGDFEGAIIRSNNEANAGLIERALNATAPQPEVLP